jgi:hypothetical protein
MDLDKKAVEEEGDTKPGNYKCDIMTTSLIGLEGRINWATTGTLAY